MGSLSIQKGKRAERAVASLLNPVIANVCAREGVDVQKLQRNLKQVQEGGFDLDGLDWIAIEIKHHKQVSLGAWWAQCERQATGNRWPVLIWKQHGGKWQVRTRGQIPLSDGMSVRGVVDVSFDLFLVWFEFELTCQIRAAIATGDLADVAEALGMGEPSAASSAERPIIDDLPAMHVVPSDGLPAAKPWEVK